MPKKQCRKTYQAAYWLANKDRLKRKKAAYRKAHRAEFIRWKADYRRRHPDRIKAAARAYYARKRS